MTSLLRRALRETGTPAPCILCGRDAKGRTISRGRVVPICERHRINDAHWLAIDEAVEKLEYEEGEIR